MQVHFGVDLLEAEWPASVACIGTFDGVHLGHREVIRTAVDVAASRELPCVLITFDRHPAATLAPDRCPSAVASLTTNLRQFHKLGVAVVAVLTFDRALSQTSAEDFFENVIRDKLRAEAMVIGHDFAFGEGREGTPEWLKQHIETRVVPAFLLEGARVSSSEVRRLVSEGAVEQAARLLGRPFEIQGAVVAGQKLGRELGFPTANLARSFDQVTPADGIYAGACETRLGDFRAAISIGLRPTIGGSTRTIEAYLLDYPGDSLYGQSLTLKLVRRLREERLFNSLDELKKQMARDVEDVCRVL